MTGNIGMPLHLPKSLTGDGRSCRDVITKFLGLMGYQFSSPTELRWHVSRAEALL